MFLDPIAKIIRQRKEDLLYWRNAFYEQMGHDTFDFNQSDIDSVLLHCLL